MLLCRLGRSKKQEKLIKLFSAVIYFDMNQPVDSLEEKCSLRELQHHFNSDEEPLSFLDYARKLSHIYRNIHSQASQ